MLHRTAKITIEDVAERAGVSTATVSRVLNESPLVAARTRDHVSRAIEEMRFRPDRTARSLAGRRLETLVVAIPTFTTPFHIELLKGVREAANRAEMELLIWDLEWRDVHRALSRFLNRGAVTGLLLVGTPADRRVSKELETLRSPAVLVGARHDDYDSLYWDDVAGARMAVTHLIDQGHRRIGFIRATPWSDIQQQRLEGYREALEVSGIPFDERLVASGQTDKHAGFSEEAGFEAMKTLLEIEDPVTAVFASSDVQAVGAWKAIHDAELTVPNDIALVGYDDIKMSRFIELSSVDQGAHSVGAQAASVLIERVRESSRSAPLSKHVVPQLRIRASSTTSIPSMS